jgi:hypothetical protein
MITGIDAGLKNAHLEIGYFGSLEPSDKFFRFAREHGSANHFYPACLFVVLWFYKHVWFLFV